MVVHFFELELLSQSLLEHRFPLMDPWQADEPLTHWSPLITIRPAPERCSAFFERSTVSWESWSIFSSSFLMNCEKFLLVFMIFFIRDCYKISWNLMKSYSIPDGCIVVHFLPLILLSQFPFEQRLSLMDPWHEAEELIHLLSFTPTKPPWDCSTKLVKIIDSWLLSIILRSNFAIKFENLVFLSMMI